LTGVNAEDICKGTEEKIEIELQNTINCEIVSLSYSAQYDRLFAS